MQLCARLLPRRVPGSVMWLSVAVCRVGAGEGAGVV